MHLSEYNTMIANLHSSTKNLYVSIRGVTVLRLFMPMKWPIHRTEEFIASVGIGVSGFL